MLAAALKNLPVTDDPNLLVGFNKADDAGVYKISDEIALVQTLDFFPPIVDDAFQFGQIAAANALSDVYAMGGKPLTALNIVGFPVSTLPPEILNDVLRGGVSKIEEAGAVVVGGHSINDKELKYGVSVTGLVHPDKFIANDGAKPGDILFLTKPLGTGIITTGIKREKVEQDMIDLVITTMTSLNKTASELMVEFSAHACTDITGFGLAGHSYEMADASGVTIEIESSKLPLLPGVVELAGEGVIPGGANSNRSFMDGKIKITETVDEQLAHVLFDPQTSGGLLIAIDPSRADEFAVRLSQLELPSQPIGRVISSSTAPIIVK